jgi:hypothetical protein
MSIIGGEPIMAQIKVVCTCGRRLKPEKLGYHTKDELIKLLDIEPMPEALLNPLKPKNSKRLSLKELVEVLKLRIRPIAVECKECHAVIDLYEKLVSRDDGIVVKPYRGYCENRYLGGFPSFNG